MFICVEPDNEIEWDRIVSSFSKYDVYYLNGYSKSFMLNGDGVPLLLYYQGEKYKAINVVMKRDIADLDFFKSKMDEGSYFDLTTPYGYGGWLIDGEKNDDNLEQEYLAWCKQHNVICEFVRFHPMLFNHRFMSDFYEVTELGNVVHMDLTDEDIIWNNITSKNRNVIRKAINSDIKIRQGNSKELYEIFKSIYDATMKKDNAKQYYFFNEEFYNSIRTDLSDYARIFYAEKDKKIIAASIIIGANGLLNYHLSGSLTEYQQYAPNNLLLYEVAKWGSKNGYKSFYLGGGVGAHEDSLFKFKRSFYRGELNHYYIGKRIFDKEVYDNLVRQREFVVTTDFFPLYRA